MENKEIYLKKIGANIKAIRIEKKKEVKEVALALEMSDQAYYKIENGGTDVNISRLFEIAQYFEVSFMKVLCVNEGDTFYYTSQNNSGGYHVQTIGVLNITDENFKSHFENEIMHLKQKILFYEEALNKTKKE